MLLVCYNKVCYFFIFLYYILCQFNNLLCKDEIILYDQISICYNDKCELYKYVIMIDYGYIMMKVYYRMLNVCKLVLNVYYIMINVYEIIINVYYIIIL